MSKFLARDSAVWWLIIVGALVTYMADKPAPAGWHYADWMQFAAFIVATLAGKLSTSPLASQQELSAGTRSLFTK